LDAPRVSPFQIAQKRSQHSATIQHTQRHIASAAQKAAHASAATPFSGAAPMIVIYGEHFPDGIARTFSTDRASTALRT
jgi:hypothetical protein